MSPSQFLQLGLELMGYDLARQRRVRSAENLARFRCNYGVGPGAIRATYHQLQETEIAEAKIDKPNSFYFLIAINWLFVYKKEKQMAGIFRTDEDTLQQHIQKYVDAISPLKGDKIKFDVNLNPETFLLSVDGVHFRIHEPRCKPSARWCSFKFKSAGLAHEI